MERSVPCGEEGILPFIGHGQDVFDMEVFPVLKERRASDVESEQPALLHTRLRTYLLSGGGVGWPESPVIHSV